MNRRELLISASLGAFLAWLPGQPAASAGVHAPTPPRAARRPVRIEQLGRVRIDNYAWLRAENWDEARFDPALLDAEIIAHLEAENAYAEAVLEPLTERRGVYAARMSALQSEPTEAPALETGGFAYRVRHPLGADHPEHVRTLPDGSEEIVFAPGDRARRHAYYRPVAEQHSPDHRYFVWAEDTEGGDAYRICAHDLQTGETVEQPNAEAFGWEGVVVSPCSRFVFWTRRNARGRPTRVYRTPLDKLGDSTGADTLVYEETDEALFLSVRRAASGAHIAIRISGPVLDEWRLIAAGRIEDEPVLVEPRTPGLRYEVEDWGGTLVILTDADQAIDGQIVTAPREAPGRENWRVLVVHQPGTHILDIRPFAGHLARRQRRNGRLEIVTRDLNGAEHVTGFDDDAYGLAFDGVQEHSGSRLRLIHQSPREPAGWISCDMSSGETHELARQRIGGGFRRDDYEVLRLNAPSPDGAQIPLTVLRRRTPDGTGPKPVLLYGYGAYGVSTEANFSPEAIALVDQGWIYAIAHVRGGSEQGRRWFLDGRREKKVNSFIDFNACAEHLLDQGLARAGGIVGYGLSAGGLLVGGAVNRAPGLYAGIIAQVPFVDMLNTMSDADHPLVPLFRPDWGDPLADPDAYDWIAAISPYENVRPQPYPAILATAGVRDPRVSYWEPAKWTAALREATTSDNPVLFMTDMAAGHQTSGGVSDRHAQMALFWAFADFAAGRA